MSTAGDDKPPPVIIASEFEVVVHGPCPDGSAAEIVARESLQALGISATYTAMSHHNKDEQSKGVVERMQAAVDAGIHRAVLYFDIAPMDFVLEKWASGYSDFVHLHVGDHHSSEWPRFVAFWMRYKDLTTFSLDWGHKGDGASGVTLARRFFRHAKFAFTPESTPMQVPRYVDALWNNRVLDAIAHADTTGKPTFCARYTGSVHGNKDVLKAAMQCKTTEELHAMEARGHDMFRKLYLTLRPVLMQVTQVLDKARFCPRPGMRVLITTHSDARLASDLANFLWEAMEFMDGKSSASINAVLFMRTTDTSASVRTSEDCEINALTCAEWYRDKFGGKSGGHDNASCFYVSKEIMDALFESGEALFMGSPSRYLHSV